MEKRVGVGAAEIFADAPNFGSDDPKFCRQRGEKPAAHISNTAIEHGLFLQTCYLKKDTFVLAKIFRIF